MLIFVRRRTAKQLLFLSPCPPLQSHRKQLVLGKERCHPTGHRPQTVRQPLRRLKSKSRLDPTGHQDSDEPSTVDGARPPCCQPRARPSHVPAAHAPLPTLFSKTKHTRKAHLVRCTHTRMCVKKQTLAKKKGKKKSMLNKRIKQAESSGRWYSYTIFQAAVTPKRFSYTTLDLPYSSLALEVLYFPKGSSINSQVNSLFSPPVNSSFMVRIPPRGGPGCDL